MNKKLNQFENAHEPIIKPQGMTQVISLLKPKLDRLQLEMNGISRKSEVGSKDSLLELDQLIG